MAVEVKIEEAVNVDALLSHLSLELRQTVLRRAVKSAGTIVANAAKKLCPKPGYSGDKPGLKPLRDTIGTVVREYENGKRFVAVVGPQWPAGAHGHLVEFGHAEVLFGTPTGRRVPAHPFLRPAADGTKNEQLAAVEKTIRDAIDGATK